MIDPCFGKNRAKLQIANGQILAGMGSYYPLPIKGFRGSRGFYLKFWEVLISMSSGEIDSEPRAPASDSDLEVEGTGPTNRHKVRRKE